MMYQSNTTNIYYVYYCVTQHVSIHSIYLNAETVPHFAVSIQSQKQIFGVLWGRTFLELQE